MKESTASTIVTWNSKEGKARLFASKYSQDFFLLCNFFQPQLKPTYCGIASAVIVLNAMRAGKNLCPNQEALEVKKPDAAHAHMAYRSYSQITFLDENTDHIKPKERIEGICHAAEEEFSPGLSLGDLRKKLQLHHCKVKICHAKAAPDVGTNRLRHDLKAFLTDPGSFMVANFFGKHMGLKVGGHFSPVVAYHPESDSVLIMDVAGHQHPWFWVDVPSLYHAMHTKDNDAYRGYLIVEEGVNEFQR